MKCVVRDENTLCEKSGSKLLSLYYEKMLLKYCKDVAKCYIIFIKSDKGYYSAS